MLPNEQARPWTPETLEEIESKLEGLRRNMLCDLDTAGADPISEQHYMLALSSLEQTRIQIRLAKYHQSRALAGQ